ncbi:aromatic ring-hydroxylating oxygenase subunit alpha [Novosphingobium lentum]|uniref:aromatic ring-hydroxylating oxygenase subunit alpha n=1 Tax=Novosphingobium lentum TaxID=145287 RepID=UPI0008324C3D|nr:aromatic ring-hydroxylating dioxygenase subunit alpha [Novosphingobium lentum]
MLTADAPSSARVAPHRAAQAPTYQQVIARDAVPPLPIFTEVAPSEVAVDAVDRTRYLDPAFAQAEREAMWSRVWYLAARVEQVPEAGDFITYEGPLGSLIVVRDDAGTIRAFRNSCPHRGMKLCVGDGAVARITCPFHSFSWHLDGSLAHIPSRWDFAEAESRDLSLPAVRAEEWQGFVFVNHDPAAPPLDQYLGRMLTDFAAWDHGKRYAAKILRKTMHANWKACIETFIEAFHLVGIHPQALPFGGDTSAQYDVWPDQPHMSRMLQPLGIKSDQYPRDISEQDILAAAMQTIMGPEADVPVLSEDATARAFLAQMLRSNPATPAISDTELLDAMQYSIFPNVVLFRSTFYPYLYRFTPDAADPNRTTYDFYLFEPLPEGEEVPPPVEIIELADDTAYSQSGVFPPWLGQIYDQDTEGLARLQAGLRAGGHDQIVYARYQEVRLRQLHQVLDSYLARGPVVQAT